MQEKIINGSCDYWFNFEKKKIFFSSDLILGHSAKRSSFDSNRSLFLGVRNGRLIYNHEYLFLNFIKKIALLKKLVNANCEFVFLTARREFVPILKKYAEACYCKWVFYESSADLEVFFNHKSGSESDSPIFLLFNNDNGVSYNCIQNLIKKKSMTFSIMDTNSLGIDYFFCMYGNDDSVMALSFYARLLSELINRRKTISTIGNTHVNKENRFSAFKDSEASCFISKKKI